MKKAIIYDTVSDCPIETVFMNDPEIWIDEQIIERRWGDIDDFYFEISEYDPDAEQKGILVSLERPENPTPSQLWMHPDFGVLYSWDVESQKWLSVDRAAFIPEEKMRSDADVDIAKK